MKFRFWTFGAAIVISLSMASSASAGDIDGDLVDDAVDNCSTIPNGPNDPSNQIDTDQDGFGNRCDCDFTQDSLILGDDIFLQQAAFNTTQELYDIDGDGFVLGSDVILCITSLFSGPPGPGPFP